MVDLVGVQELIDEEQGLSPVGSSRLGRPGAGAPVFPLFPSLPEEVSNRGGAGMLSELRGDVRKTLFVGSQPVRGLSGMAATNARIARSCESLSRPVHFSMASTNLS